MEDLANVLTVRLPELLEEGSRQARAFAPIARLEDYINDFELYSPDEEEIAEVQGEVEVASEASGLREHPLEPAGGKGSCSGCGFLCRDTG